MRQFQVLYPDEEGTIETYSENEILGVYFPYWYTKMCEKFGQEHVDANFSWKDCLEDWIIVNWAEEVK